MKEFSKVKEMFRILIGVMGIQVCRFVKVHLMYTYYVYIWLYTTYTSIKRTF